MIFYELDDTEDIPEGHRRRLLKVATPMDPLVEEDLCDRNERLEPESKDSSGFDNISEISEKRTGVRTPTRHTSLKPRYVQMKLRTSKT